MQIFNYDNGAAEQKLDAAALLADPQPGTHHYICGPAGFIDHAIEIPMSCEQGVCGTCVTRILEGEVDQRDMYLTDAEREQNDQFTPCCSRANSKLLVLDL